MGLRRNPASVPLLFVKEFCGEVDGIFICLLLGLLHERFIFLVEAVVHHIVLQQTAYPYTSQQETDKTCHCSNNIENRQRDIEHPPIEEEQRDTNRQDNPDLAPLDFLILDTLRAEARKGKKK